MQVKKKIKDQYGSQITLLKFQFALTDVACLSSCFVAMYRQTGFMLRHLT